jgi:hypothetical protein
MIPVIAISECAPTQRYYCWEAFNESLRRLGHEATILGWGQPYIGLMSRLKKGLPYLKTITDEHVIITDAWDVLFLESPLAIVEKFRALGKPIVWSSERLLFPPGDYGEYPKGTTDSRYLNCGWGVGEREAFIALFEHMKVMDVPDDFQKPDGSWKHFLDQEYLHHAFVEQFVPQTLDYESALCQNMWMTKPGEIDLGERARNTVTGQFPSVLHWNGPAKTNAPVTIFQGVAWWKQLTGGERPQ